MAIQSYAFWGQWKGGTGLNSTIYNGLISQGVEDVASESPESPCFRLPHCYLTPPLQGTPRISAQTLHCQKLESLGYVFVIP